MYSRRFHDLVSHTIMKNSKSKTTSKGGRESREAFVATSDAQYKTATTGHTTKVSRRIVNREFIGTIASSILFTTKGYDINPGIATTFPWLSTQASGWEQYRFHKLTFEYITRVATSTAGSVILTPEYDPTDPPPSDEKVATNTTGSVEDSPWKNMKCVLDASSMHPLGPRKYIRTSRTGGDPRTFDVGTFFVSCIGFSSAIDTGKLYASYDVELFVPQTGDAIPKASFTSTLVQDANLALGTGATTEFKWIESALLETTVPAGLYTDGCHVLAQPSASSVTLYFPAGVYNCDFNVQLTNTVSEYTELLIEVLVNNSVKWASHTSMTMTANKYWAPNFHFPLLASTDSTVKIRATAIAAAGTVTSYGPASYAGGCTMLRVTPA